ncbi:MAG: hypothetical protein AAF318_12355 [Pseudomonadota bacterium]
MKLAPFGALNNFHTARRDSFLWPKARFNGTEAEYTTIIEDWVTDVADQVWPLWQGGQWKGNAAAKMTDAAKAEVEIIIDAYQKINKLSQIPSLPAGATHTVEHDHRWHYRIEDAIVLDRCESCKPKTIDDANKTFPYRASRDVGSNFIAYSDAIRLDEWENLFWRRATPLHPDLFGLKERFMRPRPWAAAAALGVSGFRWEVGDPITHTGVHPSILSGHCIQGLLGACHVIDERPDLPAELVGKIAQYGVDWGDRRVFAGVHYPTDNIASWVLAARLIPKMFKDPARVMDFATQALKHSAVYQTVQSTFSGVLLPPLELLNKAYPVKAF